MNSPAVLITCEHGGNSIPPKYAVHFRSAKKDLESHRGYDRGALEIAKTIAATLGAPLIAAHVSRLLVELNRSPHHPRLFSRYSRQLNREAKQGILDEYYYPYRRRVEDQISSMISRHRSALHLSVHTFTPRFAGANRIADVGLLYDPGRYREKKFCIEWQRALRSHLPRWRIRRNYPYLGKSDGLTTCLRRQFPADQYVGIELEVNRRHHVSRRWSTLRLALAESLQSTIGEFSGRQSKLNE